MWQSHSPHPPALGTRLETNSNQAGNKPGWKQMVLSRSFLRQLGHSCSPGSPRDPQTQLLRLGGVPWDSYEVVLMAPIKWKKKMRRLTYLKGRKWVRTPGDAASNEHNRTQKWPGASPKSEASPTLLPGDEAVHNPMVGHRIKKFQDRAWVSEGVEGWVGGKHSHGHVLWHCYPWCHLPG